MADYIFLAQMDIPPEHEAEFNRIYDEEHVPTILKVPGVHGCTRYKLESAKGANIPRYAALYEIDSPAIPDTEAWRNASDTGSWKPKIRPHTFNRIHCVFKKIG